ncbi:MAG: deoxyribose-phosphate aldolase [Bacteroidales bacterium]|nr:deoxyribose-phosphate aldolase [Bacteroidales bacterium]
MDFTTNDIDKLKRLFGCIDNTSLGTTDTPQTIAALCDASVAMQGGAQGIPHVASVCVYPPFVEQAKQRLSGTGIRVASVAGAFPSGKLPLELKYHEIRYVVEHGADEVDMVIDRGRFLAEGPDAVYDEVVHCRHACGAATLKVILETCDLPSSDAIYQASMAALEASADFIKTSTGKGLQGATPEAAEAMLRALSDFHKKSVKKVGFKAAGGISTAHDALFYYNLFEKYLPGEHISNEVFRIGASRLTKRIFELLT